MKEKIKELSIEEKIGQMLMIGLDIANPKDKIEEIITKYKIGGVLLYKKNYKSYEELVDLINYIKKKNETREKTNPMIPSLFLYLRPSGASGTDSCAGA